MAPRLSAAPGQLLEGRFLLVGEIGHGGMSTVFSARDLENRGRLVAVKVPLPQYSSGLGSWSMFQREAEIGEQLDHPSILRFIRLPPSKHRAYVVTEHVTGTLLSTRVENGSALAEPEALRLVSRLCEAVAYLHSRGFVHYDLKPGNVILCDDGSLRLIDLGLAHRIARRSFTLSSPAPAIASAEYVAPEQLRRQRGRTSVDIYALGAMLYEMLTGHAPFEGDDPFVLASAREIGDPEAPRRLNPSISAEVEEIVLRALRRDPAERYQSAAELKADLDHPEQVRVSGLSRRLIEVTRWRRNLRRLQRITLIGVAPIAVLVLSFRLLWWYLEWRH